MKEVALRDDRSEDVQYDFTDYSAYIRKDLLSQYDYAAVSHWHDDIELIYILSGEMQYQINWETVTLTQGSGIFVNSRQLHYGFSQNRTESEFICIILHPLMLCSTPGMEHQYVMPLMTNLAFPFQLLDEKTAWQSHILNAIQQIYDSKDTPDPELKIQSLFFLIWDELYSHAPKDQAPSKQSHQLSVLKDMVGYMQKHYKEKISLEDIAAAGNVCKSKCCSLYRSYFNQTPISYLTGYRLKKGTDLLKNTDMSITEISYEVGFTGASYFTETFRKYYGCSPTRFRSTEEALHKPKV